MFYVPSSQRNVEIDTHALPVLENNLRAAISAHFHVQTDESIAAVYKAYAGYIAAGGTAALIHVTTRAHVYFGLQMNIGGHVD